MKKEIKKIASMALLSVLFVGCAKDFFDPEVNEYLTDQRKKELQGNAKNKKQLLEIELRGIYNNNAATQNSNHDGFGLKAVDAGFDHTGLDLVQASRSWFIFDYNFDNKKANFRRPAFVWNFLYKQISSINTVLADYFPTAPDTNTEQEVYQKYGELKTMRAIFYYYLVNTFAKTYVGNQGSLGVPLMLNPGDDKLPRATVQQVYDQMLSDLKPVVDDARFQITPDNKADADKAVGAAYLAKIYACQGNWPEVQRYALVATEGDRPSLTSSADVQAGKWDISMNSWLWGFDITQETNTYWNSFYANMDNSIPSSYAGGGAFKLIYSNLYAKIGDQDVRKKLYINETLFPDIAAKYRAMNPHLPKYANVKYVTNTDFTSDYCYLRREDPYLLYIEALVENNLLDEAKAALEYLVKDNREDTAYNLSALTTQQQLREEVRLQRRIELWGEGTSFFDWKRWKTGINRYEAGSNHLLKVEVPAESEKWTYQIPKAEMESNPNMVQNE